MVPIIRTRPRKEMRERQRVASERRQFPRGPAIRFCQPIGGELPWSGTNLWPRLAPSRRQPPSRQPWRATQPPSPQQRHFQYKILSFSDIHNTPLCRWFLRQPIYIYHNSDTPHSPLLPLSHKTDKTVSQHGGGGLVSVTVIHILSFHAKFLLYIIGLFSEYIEIWRFRINVS